MSEGRQRIKMTPPEQGGSRNEEVAAGAFGARAEYDITESVWVEFREGVATFVFAVKEHGIREVVPAEAYLRYLEGLLAKAMKVRRL